MIRQPSPLRVASWTPVATLPASNSQRAVNINGISRPYFGLHFPKACNFKLTKVSSSKLTLTRADGGGGLRWITYLLSERNKGKSDYVSHRNFHMK